MTNEELIERIRGWKHGVPDFGREGYLSFWSIGNGENVRRLEPRCVATSNIGVNDHWFDGDYQLLLTKHSLAVYSTRGHPDYPLIGRLPLIESRDEAIAAVRMMIALEVDHE